MRPRGPWQYRPAGGRRQRRIVGSLWPFTTRVLFTGTDLAGKTADTRARQGVAHVPEGRGFFYSLTVAEHFRLKCRGEIAAAGASADLRANPGLMLSSYPGEHLLPDTPEAAPEQLRHQHPGPRPNKARGLVCSCR